MMIIMSVHHHHHHHHHGAHHHQLLRHRPYLFIYVSSVPLDPIRDAEDART